MKAFIALTLLTLTTGVFAETVCYVPEQKNTSIPQEICFERVAADTHKEVVFIKDTQGFFLQNLMQITSLEEMRTVIVSKYRKSSLTSGKTVVVQERRLH